jgi:tetratricopeptide (TPR) repeat protein
MRVKNILMGLIVFLAASLAAATSASAQADAGGRAGGSMAESDSTFRPKPKPRVKRVIPRAPVRMQKSAAAYEADGDRFYTDKDYDSALEAYENAAKIKPSAHALYRIGWIHNDYEEYDQALPFLDRSLALGPQVSYVHVEKGYSLRHLNRNAEALAEFNRAVQLDSSSTLGYLGIGDVYFYGTKEYEKAIDAYKRGLQLDNTKHVAAYNIGWAYNELENYTDGIKYLTQATTIKPDYASAYSEMGYAYNRLDQPTNSINAYQQALDYDPSSTSALFGLGDVYYNKEKNYELAAEKYKSGLAIKSDNANAWQRLGYCYNDLERYDEAITALTKAKQLKPNLDSAYVELGYAYFKLQRYSEAASTFKQASSINPTGALAHYYLGQVYLATNNRNGAMAEYRTLQSLGSDYAKKLYGLINK